MSKSKLTFTHSPQTETKKSGQQIVLVLSQELHNELLGDRSIIYGDLSIEPRNGKWFGHLNTNNGHYGFSETPQGTRRIRFPCAGEAGTSLRQLPFSGQAEVSEYLIDGNTLVFEIPEPVAVRQYNMSNTVKNIKSRKISVHASGRRNKLNERAADIAEVMATSEPPMTQNVDLEAIGAKMREIQTKMHVENILKGLDLKTQLRVIGELQRQTVRGILDQIRQSGNDASASASMEDELPYVFIDYRAVERF